jgi:two-component system copper resistance phosphate regulon response regulator CusR
LLVEDDEVIAERIQAGLEKARYTVDVAYDGEHGLALAKDGAYALIILDVMLPRRDGWSVLEALRRRNKRVPVLMLTARDGVDDRVKGLDLGADDYLPKPFDFKELTARVRALLRRESVTKSNVIRIGDLEIDVLARSTRRGGKEVSLTPHEFSLLEALARNSGRTLTREMIQECIWGDDESYSNVVSFHVASLRKKIDAAFPTKLIHTVYGVGYVLRDPTDEAAP